MKCVHTSNSRLINHPCKVRSDPAEAPLPRSSPTKAPVHFLCAACRSPFAPLRRGERPTGGSDEGTYRQPLSCKNQELPKKVATVTCQTQDFIVGEDHLVAEFELFSKSVGLGDCGASVLLSRVSQNAEWFRDMLIARGEMGKGLRKLLLIRPLSHLK